MGFSDISLCTNACFLQMESEHRTASDPLRVFFFGSVVTGTQLLSGRDAVRPDVWSPGVTSH